MNTTKWMRAAALGVCVVLAAAGPKANAVQKSGYQPRTARGAAVKQFVLKWAAHVEGVYGTPPMAWAKSMGRTFAEADVRSLQRANAMTTYTQAMGTMLQGQSSSAPVTTRLASPSVASAFLQSSPEELVYVPVAPCRILDTRNAGGRLSNGEARPVFVHGASFTSQGGAAESCGIPADPAAVVINVVAVGASDNGFLSVYPYGGARAASSLNYGTGSIVANDLIAKTTVGQPFDIALYSQAAADVVIDITGYFVAAVPPSTFTTVIREQESYFVLAPGEVKAVTSLCLPGETPLNGSPSAWTPNITLVNSALVSEGRSHGWTIEWKNTGTASVNGMAGTSALCTAGTLTRG